MVSIAVVEDVASERSLIRNCLDHIEKTEKTDISVTEFSSGLELIGNYMPVYDIILLDIEMPGMDGLETARAIRKTDANVILIFVTNLAQYAVQGYEVEALDFILKPINKYSFAMKLMRAISRTEKRRDQSIIIKSDKETLSISVASIKYIEVVKHYVTYHTVYGNHSEYITMKEAEKKINSDCFVKCNRCYIVNLKFVTSITKDEVVIGSEKLLMSRSQKKEFFAAYTTFLGGGNNV